ncbi:MAG TPA: mechanosensitive ion channel domain-containing protein [Burkholderiales bacterium]|nr:mechanosensitive ion channel domain-containing protein [Burkholderiales bacterium]
MEEQIKLMDHVATLAIDMGMKFGPKLLVAVAILVAGFFAGRWAGRALGRALGRFRLEPPVMALMERAVQIVVLGLFVIMALQNLGVELLPLIAGLSIAGAGVALAMQGVLGNVVAGLTIIFARPFRVGDYISIVKEEGEVLEIKLFSTTLGHADRSRVVIPNRKIVGEILHNYGRVRQLALEVGIAYGSDVDAALAAIRAALAANPRVLKDPVPTLGVAKLADSSLTVAAGPWVSIADAGPAVGELNKAILDALQAARIEIPFPQREIRMVASTAYVGRKEGGAYAGSA